MIIERLRTVYKHYQELAIPIIMSGGIGISVIFISLADGFNTDLFSYIMPVKLRQVLICHGLKLFCIAVKMKMFIHAGNVCDFIGNRADIMGDKNECLFQEY